MKKFIMVLVALALVVPALAAQPQVDITCSVGGSNNDEVTVSFNNVTYSPPTDSNAVRAFGFIITVDNGAVIESWDCVQEHAQMGTAGYWVHPGCIVIEPNGVVSDYGSCVCGDICTSEIIVGMASLYATPAGPPAQKNSALCKFTVSKDCTITIVGDTMSTGSTDGVVMEDPSLTPIVNLSGCSVVNVCTCKGDVWGPIPPNFAPDGVITSTDVSKIIGWFYPYTGQSIPVTTPLQACADVWGPIPPNFAPDGVITSTDVSKIIGWFYPYTGQSIACPAGPCD